MHSQPCGEGESRQRYYRCSARRRFGTTVCDAEFVPAHVVEAQILDMLRALTILPPIRDAVIAVVERRITQPATPEARDITKLQTQLERLKDLYSMGDLEKAEYIRRREGLQRQLAQTWPA